MVFFLLLALYISGGSTLKTLFAFRIYKLRFHVFFLYNLFNSIFLLLIFLLFFTLTLTYMYKQYDDILINSDQFALCVPIYPPMAATL